MGRAAIAGFSPGTECCLCILWMPATGAVVDVVPPPAAAASDEVKPYDPDEVRTGFVAGNGGGPPPLGVVAALPLLLLLLFVVALLIFLLIHNCFV